LRTLLVEAWLRNLVRSKGSLAETVKDARDSHVSRDGELRLQSFFS